MAWRKVLAVAVAVVAAPLMFASPVAASAALDPVDVAWNQVTQNGASDGTCDTVGEFPDLNPGPGQQGWLFILTKPFNSNGSVLTVDFSLGPDSPVPGVHKGGGGGGTYHYAVYVPVTATLISASATNGTSDPGGSNLVVSHCEGEGNGNDPSSVITSEVHLAGTHADITNSSAPAGSTVHDEVTLTVTGLTEWSGTFTLDFFTNNECSGDPEPGSLVTIWNNLTSMPQDNLLPKGPLAVGGYSYQESFDSQNNNLDVVGECEPFEIVAEQTTRTTDPGTTPPGEHPPTGVSLTGLILAGVALVAGGSALVYFRRRRDATGTTL